MLGTSRPRHAGLKLIDHDERLGRLRQWVIKGMMVTIKTLTLTGIDLFTNSSAVEKEKSEFNAATGAGFQYKALLGDRKPALNYRD